MRKEVTGKLTFFNTFNMGYEGFSKPWKTPKMNPISGGRNEFMFLALLVPAVLLLKSARQKNEEAVRSALGYANNRYAHLATVQPSQW